MSDEVKIELCDGKYTYIRAGGRQEVLRYGEPWRDETGDGFILAMAQKIEDLQEQLAVAHRDIELLRTPDDH